jgi:hypothetical protein
VAGCIILADFAVLADLVISPVVRRDFACSPVLDGCSGYLGCFVCIPIPRVALAVLDVSGKFSHFCNVGRD